MIAGAGVCILSQHSILEYFSSFLCILLGIACNNVEYQISPVGWKVEGDNFYRWSLLKAARQKLQIWF